MTTTLEFVDAHVHFWNLQHPDLYWQHLQEPGFVHPVFGTQLRKLAVKNYEVDDYIAETRGWNVTKAIHMQAAIGSEDPVKETEWLQDCADRTGFPHGIVAYADLRDPEVESVLARHCEYPNVRGIRDFSYGNYLEHSDYVRGLGLLRNYGLVASLDVKWPDMGKLRVLAERVPDVPIVLDHAGFPTERTPAYFDSWRHGIDEIADCENVVCKLSGFGMGDNQWTTARIEPWIQHCIGAFGPSRVLFASNWPVDSLWGQFGDVVSAYRTIIGGYSPDDQQDMFSRNAERLYSL